MKTRTKSASVLLGTLVLGVVIGVLAQTALQNQRMEKVRALRNRGALPDVILHVVKPRDDSQAEVIRAVVTRYEEAHSGLLKDYWAARSELFDAMHHELVTNVLFEDQVEALDSWRERNRRSGRSGNQQGGGERDKDQDDRRGENRHAEGRSRSN